MMKQNNVLRRLFAALLALLTLVSFTALPALAVEDDAADPEAVKPAEASAPQPEDAEEETISIATADDLLALAESCTLDAWSQDKRVVLEADLDLTGLDFTPIATFGGTFSGNGHTIRGLTITDALSPAGLICTLQPTGRVEDLSVEGTVTPLRRPGLHRRPRRRELRHDRELRLHRHSLRRLGHRRPRRREQGQRCGPRLPHRRHRRR